MAAPVVLGYAKAMKGKPKTDEIEEFPDAWERFEKAFDTVMKAKPKPRKAEKPKDGKLKLGCRNGQAKIGHD
jgi:hypothetical protein